MDLEQLRARLRELVAEMRSLTTPPDEAGDDWDMADEAVTRFDAAETEAATLRDRIATAERRLAAIAESEAVVEGDDSTPAPRRSERFGTPNVNRAGDPYDLSSLRMDTTPQDLRARALSAIEADPGSERWALDAAAATLRNVRDHGQVASLFLHTGSPAYRSAFLKSLAGQTWALDDSERQALSAAMRAQSLTTTAGGFAVPFTLDPTVVLTNNSATNPIRNIARKVQITTNTWNGVTSAGATASWDAEAAEVSDDAVTLAQPSIPVFKMQIFIPFSVEIEGDWAGIESDLRMAMVDARDRLEATAHITGNGTSAPTGIQTELDGGSSEIAPATAETFALADVYNLQRQLPPRYRMSADMPTWVGSLGTANKIRQFDTGGGGGLWTQLGNGTPERLLGWRWAEHSEVDDALDINAAATADNFIMFVGDWSRYVIVDRVGMQVELVPHLLHTSNNLPKGQRGLLGWLRTGAESIDDNAFRTLSIPTTA